MTVVVGISRRNGSPDALRWAVDEARIRGTRVLAVTAWRPPRPPAAPAARPPGVSPIPAEQARSEERQRLVELMEQQLGGPLEAFGVEYELRTGAPTAVLLAAAAEGELLVLDSPRTGDLSAVRKSWIAPSIVLRSQCPVVVMPRMSRPHEHSVLERLADAAAEAGRPGLKL